MRDDRDCPNRYLNLACRVTSWHGEIVTTVFVHTAIQGKHASTWSSRRSRLPPVRGRYQAIGRVEVARRARHIRAVARALWTPPGRGGQGSATASACSSAGRSPTCGPGYEAAMFLERSVGARFSMRE